MKAFKSILQFQTHFNTDAKCRAFLEELFPLIKEDLKTTFVLVENEFSDVIYLKK